MTDPAGTGSLGHGEHPYGLAHHFEDFEQQNESMNLGMWAFLASEVMFFGAVFVGLSIYRSHYPHAFAEASNRLDVPLGTFNTVVLIGSSLTMALAVRAGQLGRRKQITGWLLATIGLAFVFFGVKAVEYSHKFHDHLFPGPNFTKDFPDPASEIFFGFYFGMTGLHALHMVIGVVVMAVIAVKAWRGRYTSSFNFPVEMTGLYWHFVDLVWIFLFPMLYLIGRHL